MATCCRDSSPDQSAASDRTRCGGHAATQPTTGQDACCTAPETDSRLSGDAPDRTPR